MLFILLGYSSTYEDTVGVSEAVTNQGGYCIHTGTTQPQLHLHKNCILTQLYPHVQPSWGYSWVVGVSEAVTNLGHEAATGALGPPCVSQSASEYQNTRTLTRNTQTQLYPLQHVFRNWDSWQSVCFTICITQMETFKKHCHINICSKICIPVSTHKKTHNKRINTAHKWQWENWSANKYKYSQK